MSDKELIKQEIERIIDEETPISKGSDYYHGSKESMEKLLQFIDFLPEEPASEDLEEEIKNYFSGWCMRDSREQECFFQTARHFAEWQRKQLAENAVEGVIDIRKWPAKAQVEFYDRLPVFNVRTGDKVKIIIIKAE